MANIKSAKKQAIQSKKRYVINLARKSAVKTAFKKVTDALNNKLSQSQVQELFNQAQASCARAKGKNVYHAKTVARKISRLALKINKQFVEQK